MILMAFGTLGGQSLLLPSLQQHHTLAKTSHRGPLALTNVKSSHREPLRRIANLRGGQGAQMSIFSSNLFPIIGLFTSNALYFSPIPAVRERLKEGTIGSLNPIPTACIVLSTFAWLMYAYSVPNVWVVMSNLPGACAAMAAMTMMLPLMKGSKQLLAVQSNGGGL